jgi:hypothetical protein
LEELYRIQPSKHGQEKLKMLPKLKPPCWKGPPLMDKLNWDNIKEPPMKLQKNLWLLLIINIESLINILINSYILLK